MSKQSSLSSSSLSSSLSYLSTYLKSSFLPSVFCNNLVNFESRYGMWLVELFLLGAALAVLERSLWIFRLLADRADITFPRALRDLLMNFASLNRTPVDSVVVDDYYNDNHGDSNDDIVLIIVIIIIMTKTMHPRISNIDATTIQ